jgi:hypothetical protein
MEPIEIIFERLDRPDRYRQAYVRQNVRRVPEGRQSSRRRTSPSQLFNLFSLLV